jgi:NAD(P)-dependent dehydrogenase (short-subunit alcohol dehydrogenase family)
MARHTGFEFQGPLLMSPPTAFILGGSADIGLALIERYLASGWRVAATHRRPGALDRFAGEAVFRAFPLDLDRPETFETVATAFVETDWRWDLFVAATGDLAPVGPFLEVDGAQWQAAIGRNAFAPCRVLQRLDSARNRETIASVAFFAGGGTNNPFRNYSAYAVAKLALIKMCELLDDEIADLKCFILGPGYVATKLHQATLDAGAMAGDNLKKTTDFMATPGTSMDEIFACLEWCRTQDRATIGGRNVSVVHDGWRGGGADLAAALRADRDLFKLRRRSLLP